jgi:hypothetical protein
MNLHEFPTRFLYNLFNSADNENMYGAEGMSRSRFPINSFIIRYLEGGGRGYERGREEGG